MKAPTLIAMALGGIVAAALSSMARDSLSHIFHQKEPVAASSTKGLAVPQVGEVRDGWRFAGGDPSRKENWEPAVKWPVVGEVRQGYRFKGGDPAKETNWDKVGN